MIKKLIKYTIIFFAFFLIFNFAKNKLTKFDGTSESLDMLLIFYSIEEKLEIIDDFDFLSNYIINQDLLIGLSVDDIQSETKKIKEFIANKNIEFLENFIIELKNSNKKESFLHIDNFGQISKPQMGYSYNKKYTLSDLQDIIKYNGDYQSFKYLLEFKNGFFKSCKDAICKCVFNKLVDNYSAKEIHNLQTLPANEFLTIMKEFQTSCEKEN